MADMNLTAARPGLTPIQWCSDFWVEYLRRIQFTPYFGTSYGRHDSTPDGFD